MLSRSKSQNQKSKRKKNQGHTRFYLDLPPERKRNMPKGLGDSTAVRVRDSKFNPQDYMTPLTQQHPCPSIARCNAGRP